MNTHSSSLVLVTTLSLASAACGEGSSDSGTSGDSFVDSNETTGDGDSGDGDGDSGDGDGDSGDGDGDSGDGDGDGDSGEPVEVVIDFDDLAHQEEVLANYSTYAVFTTEQGFGVYAVGFAMDSGSSPPNLLCAGTTSNCTHELYIDFPSPVDALNLSIPGISKSGTAATVRVFHEGGQDDIPLTEEMADDNVSTPLDLSTFVGVTRVEFVDIVDPAGIGYDDISFTAYQ